MSAFCICKDQNLGPETDAYLVRYQCHFRVTAVHSSCNPGLREKAAMLLGWDSQYQIQRNDRVGLAANPEVKAERPLIVTSLLAGNSEIVHNNCTKLVFCEQTDRLFSTLG